MNKDFSQRAFHADDAQAVVAHFRSSHDGLSDFDARGRSAHFGKNVLPQQRGHSTLLLFLKQFRSPLIYIILVAATASFFVGHGTDAIFILIVVLINTTVGFFQEYKAGQALAALQKTVTVQATVIRDCSKKRIDAADIVPGDILSLEPGDRVGADARVLSAQNMKASEAALTGESRAVRKTADVLNAKTLVPDRVNMVFSGTIIEEGQGRVIVTATGAHTEIGKISTLIATQKETQTPLQKKFASLSRLIGAGVLGAISLFAIVGIIRGESLENVFITSTALVVSAIPEGLLPAVTVVLIFGMRRLARQKALVRRLNANEAMGAVTTICMDKTGTLTRGEMRVTTVLSGENELLHHEDVTPGIGDDQQDGNGVLHMQALKIAGLVNDAYIENAHADLEQWVVHGRPTDRALLLAATQSGIDVARYQKEHELVDAIAFTSVKKYAARAYVRRASTDVDVFILGAPDVLIDQMATIRYADATLPKESQEAQELFARLEELTTSGLRVLACVHKRVTREKYDAYTEEEEKMADGALVGFIALKDPVRHDVRDALRQTERAGIRSIVVTGDHRNTAESVMRELGVSLDGDVVHEGKDLADLDDAALRAMLQEAKIFARVLPEHKIRIVQALQAQGDIVAMVGDGVNDAPALKAADVGIALGSGSDIAREVSDIVLLENGFSVIAKAIEQGRLIFENIRRVFIYLVADDFSELFLFFTMMILGVPLPLLAVQILWINLIEDGFPGIALTSEQDTKGLMDRPPRDPREPLMPMPYKKFMAAVFVVSGASAVFVFLFFFQMFDDIDLARTVVFALIAFDSILFLFVLRSFTRSIFRRDIFANYLITLAALAAFILLLTGLYVPIVQEFLQVVPLDIFAWIVIVAVAIVETLILEMCKLRFLRTT